MTLIIIVAVVLALALVVGIYNKKNEAKDSKQEDAAKHI